MGKGFFWKLAAINIQKNRKTYFPYIFTCILTVAMYYMILSLAENPGIYDLLGGNIIVTILNLGCSITALFAVIFLFYTNSFLVKQRKKEMGLYNVLGMEKRHLGYVFACETLYVLAVSLILGLGIGILMDKLLFLILLKMFNGTVPMGFQIQPQVLYSTSLLFSGVFLAIYLGSLRQIHLTKPIELLYGGAMGEREPRTKWLSALLGAICLAGGYGIALTTTNPMDAIILFFIAVILVIIGTYCLFDAGSIAILKLLRRNRRFYYKAGHFIAISGMMHRMRQNAIGLANICILSTMVLVMISSTMCMYLGSQEAIQRSCPQTFVVRAEGIQEDLPRRMEAILEENQIEGENALWYRYLDYTAYRKGNRLITDPAQAEAGSVVCGVIAVLLKDYNRCLAAQYTLEANEVILIPDYARYPGDRLWIAGQEYEIRYQEEKMSVDFVVREQSISGGYILIVPDMETLLRIDNVQRQEYGEEYSGQLETYYGVDLSLEEEAQVSLREEIRKALPEEYEVGIDLRFEEENRVMGMYGGLFFIGVFLGSLFIMATILIIYYKQISEGYEDRQRFEILRKVGMDRREIRRTIHSQVLGVFFLPLLTSGIHIAFAFPFITRILWALSVPDRGLFAICTGGCFLVFALFYVLIYRETAKTYYRIVAP